MKVEGLGLRGLGLGFGTHIQVGIFTSLSHKAFVESCVETRSLQSSQHVWYKFQGFTGICLASCGMAEGGKRAGIS